MDSSVSTATDYRNKIVYSLQIVAIFVIIIFCLVNLSWSGTKEKEQLWIALLSSCLGYLMPNPRLKRE